MGEIWKPVKNLERLYEVSNLGNVKSLNFNKTGQAKLLKLQKYTKGYTYVDIRNKKLKVHRMVAEAFIDNPLNKPFVNHINAVTSDNRVENLEWVTISENAVHASKMGLLKWSENRLEQHKIRIRETGQLVSENQKESIRRNNKLLKSKNTNWVNVATNEIYFGSASSLANEHLKNPKLRRTLAEVYCGKKLEYYNWRLLKDSVVG